MTHKTGQPNHQLPIHLHVALPNALFFVQAGPPAGSPRTRLESPSGSKPSGRSFPSVAPFLLLGDPRSLGLCTSFQQLLSLDK